MLSHRFVYASLDRLLDSPEKALLRATRVKRRAQALARRGRRWLSTRWSMRSVTQVNVSTAKGLVSTPGEFHPLPPLPAVDRGCRFVLYRIIGNDLHPRHNEGQSMANLRFILEHEPDLEGCEKRWLLNRIRDHDKLQALIEVLESFGYGYDVIPFELEVFHEVQWDWDVLPSPDYLVSKHYLRLNKTQRECLEVAFYRHKNNYLMNNNGARNKALELGRLRADWVLPWDGNCFLTASGWASLKSAVLSQSSADYFHVPMLRVSNNSQLLDPALDPHPRDEPQLVFSASATERFNEAFPYGRRPKVEMFWRLGLPGPWDAWLDEPWDQPRRPRLEPIPPCPQAGWVARLHSGVRGSRSNAAVLSQQSRYGARNHAIKTSINQALLADGTPRSYSPYHSFWSSPLNQDDRRTTLKEQTCAAEKLLLDWQRWWHQGGSRPKASTEQVISAYIHLLWGHMVFKTEEVTSSTYLLDQLAELWFDSHENGLKPRLRLLRRPLFTGRIPGTSPSIRVVVQLALLSDLLEWHQRSGLDAVLSSESIGLFNGWCSSLMDHLPKVIRHPWITSRPVDLHRLYYAQLLLRQYSKNSADCVDLLLKLVIQYSPFQIDECDADSHLSAVTMLVLSLSREYIQCFSSDESLDDLQETASPRLVPPLAPIPLDNFQ